MRQRHHNTAERRLLKARGSRALLRAVCLLLAVVFPAVMLFAGTGDVVYVIGTGTRNIYQLSANGTTTSLFTTYAATQSSAMAQRPSDGMIFFITQATNGAVFTWNPATPATAPVQIGTVGATISAIPRLAFSAGGVLYAIDSTTQNLYTINQTNGAATVAAVLSGVPANTTGDMAFAPDGTLYLAATQTLFTVPVGGGAITTVGALSGLGGGRNVIGLAFDLTGTMLICDDNRQVYTVNIATLAATALANRTTVLDGDLASAPRVPLTGKVFEDVNYGGGAGRSLTASSGVGRPNARVELYDSAGNFLAATTTDATGLYTFSAVPGQTYTVRVVNSTVTSSRPGAVATLIGVQTFRTSGLTGSVGTADTNRVGGENPTLIDAGNGSTTLNALTAGTLTAQSIATVTASTSAISGIDFGFNFDTIVSTRDTGQGTLRQFLTNSNTLTNAGLAQSGQTAGLETSIFMISSGSAVPGLRAGLTNQLNGSGVASIVVASQLPAITDASTSVDGTTQTTNVGDTNPGTLGVGGTVGVDGLTLPTVSRPEVQISAARGTIGMGIQINGASARVRGLAIFGFGTAANTAGSANIEIEAVSGALIELNVLGTTATSFTDPGAATRSIGDNIYSNAGTNGTIQKNLMGFAEGKGMGMEAASTNWLVQQNEVRGNAINNSNLDGIDVENGSATHTITGNLFIANWGTGIDMFQGGGSNTVTNNTVTGNGVGTTTGLESMGIRVYSSNNTVTKNLVFSNIGAGIAVTSGATTSTISQNSIFSNGTGGKGIGIDLHNSTDNASVGTSPYVTINDLNDADTTGGNGLLNYPILQTASASGGTLTLTGFARPGSAIELFIATTDPSGFGQGKTYLTTLTEGSGADLDNTTGTYGPAAINGILQGTDTTNRFRFVIPLPAGVSNGTVLTATATLAGATSEFSGNVTVAGSTGISGKVYLDANHNSTPDSSEDWSTGSTVFVNLVSGAAVVQSISVPAGAGTFTFSNVTAGTYSIVVTNTAAATTAVAPASFSFVNPTNGALLVTITGNSIVNQNFGLFKGSLIQGKVFKDIGNGGGTANNGVIDGAEAGVSGIAVRATDGASTVYDSALTASDGSYTLFITPGATTVAVIKTTPAGLIATGASVGTTSGTYNRATDTVTFTKATEAIFTGVNFGIVPLNTFQNDEAQQALPGTTLFYDHIFTPGTAGQVTFTLASTATPANVGFTRVLYVDTNCSRTIDPAEPVITGPITTVAGTNLCIIMKVTIPPGTPLNSTDNTAITASFAYTNASPALLATYSVRDLTTVGVPTNAGLRLDKSVDKAAALPGATLTYTVTYTNDSSQPLSNLKINDTTPAYTIFVSAACGAPLPNSLTACSITAPSVGSSGAIQWTFTGTLAPSQTGTVTFSVKIQ